MVRKLWTGMVERFWSVVDRTYDLWIWGWRR